MTVKKKEKRLMIEFGKKMFIISGDFTEEDIVKEIINFEAQSIQEVIAEIPSPDVSEQEWKHIFHEYKLHLSNKYYYFKYELMLPDYTWLDFKNELESNGDKMWNDFINHYFELRQYAKISHEYLRSKQELKDNIK